MRTTFAVLCAGLILLGVAAVSFGQNQPGADDPAAVYAELQALQERSDQLDREITELEHKIERTRKAVANQHYVRDRNASTIARIEKWVDSE